MVSGPRIVLFDQKPNAFPGLKNSLEMDGFQVNLAQDGDDWLDNFEEEGDQIILIEAGKLAELIEDSKALVEENRRLTKLAEAKGQFIRLVTHELKSPIAAVENYLKLILQGYIGLADQEEVLEKCIVRTCEERQLIDDLLDMGRLDDIECLNKEPVYLDRVLKKVLSECQDDVLEKNIQLVTQVGKGIPPICGVPELVKGVWCNLVSNALKYTPDGGRISISMEFLDGQIQGSIRDTGIGISSEDQKKIFHEFFRAENARQASIAGTGLGLVLVKKIVEGLGGWISVDSVLGEGTRFDFAIPACEGERGE